MRTPYLLRAFPLYKKGKVVVDNKTKYYIWSDSSATLTLGVGETHQEALGNAEVNSRKMALDK
jgi:hypothetical protein